MEDDLGMRQEPKGHRETWEVFGKNLDSFIQRESVRLKNADYNIILGFTRGGAILANILSAKLTDTFPIEYAGPTKAAIRTIPNGIHKKAYDSPAFVMADSCAPEDRNDIDVLASEILTFKEEYGLQSVNALLVDDNLTGSTRVRFFYERLNTLDFLNIDLLAYTRNPKFEIPRLNFTIREKAEDPFTYVIMPWHKLHEASQISTEYSILALRILFTLPEDITINRILESLSKWLRSHGVQSRIKARKDYILVKRGETYTRLTLEGSDLEVRFPGAMYYPPKKCLRHEPAVFGDRSICTLGGQRLSAQSCRYCSALECSKDIVDFLERHMHASYRRVAFYDNDEEVDSVHNDIEAIDRWMSEPLKRISDLRFIDFDTFFGLDERERFVYRKSIEEEFRQWISAQLDIHKAEWIVTIGDEVVDHSNDITASPKLSDVIPIAKKRNLVPYLFIRLRKIEETPRSEWSQCGQIEHIDDWYPTIQIRIDHATKPDHGFLEFDADFDTGNPYIHLDGDSLIDAGLVPEHTYFDTQLEHHLGMPYTFFPAIISLTIASGQPKIEPINTKVLCVLDWMNSPFRHAYANPDRTAFVGRQLFRFCRFRAILDSAERVTYCEGG